MVEVVNKDIRWGFMSINKINHSWVLDKLSEMYSDLEHDDDEDYYYDFDKDLSDKENFELNELYDYYSVRIERMFNKGNFDWIKGFMDNLYDEVKDFYYVKKEDK
ncbi:MAG: hypothetical protein ACW99G_24525 [Candidatus Thorarchaeota archaeon]|jgi:hypothetical protein